MKNKLSLMWVSNLFIGIIIGLSAGILGFIALGSILSFFFSTQTYNRISRCEGMESDGIFTGVLSDCLHGNGSHRRRVFLWETKRKEAGLIMD